jgi:hypothetical protein
MIKTFSGPSGRLNLKDAYIKFGNWNISTNIDKWSGGFELIQESDIGKVFPLVGETIDAVFNGGEIYTGKIIINDGINDFIGTGELKRMYP